MIVKPEQYIFPPRSKDAIPREDTEIFGTMGWYAQLKYNDSHALIKYCKNGKIELWNRHADKFLTYTAPPELLQELATIGDKLKIKQGHTTILDGGLLHQKHTPIKNTIVLWDILVLNDKHLIGTTYDSRYNQLLEPLISSEEITPWLYHSPTKSHNPIKIGTALTENILIPTNWEHCEWDNIWDIITIINAPYTTGSPNSNNYDCKPVIEGLVFKDPSGILGYGFKEANNSEWMIRSRVITGRHNF